MITPIEDLESLLRRMDQCSAEERQQMEAAGYDVSYFKDSLHVFTHKQFRLKEINHTISKLNPNVQQAVKELAYALHISHGPSFKMACETALAGLLELSGINSDEPKAIYNIIESGHP